MSEENFKFKYFFNGFNLTVILEETEAIFKQVEDLLLQLLENQAGILGEKVMFIKPDIFCRMFPL